MVILKNDISTDHFLNEFEMYIVYPTSGASTAALWILAWIFRIMKNDFQFQEKQFGMIWFDTLIGGFRAWGQVSC